MLAEAENAASQKGNKRHDIGKYIGKGAGIGAGIGGFVTGLPAAIAGGGAGYVSAKMLNEIGELAEGLGKKNKGTVAAAILGALTAGLTADIPGALGGAAMGAGGGAIIGAPRQKAYDERYGDK